MRIPCPLCGTRDRREFYYYGASVYLDRPGEGADAAAWDNYLHLRDNPAGETKDLWHHEMGCSAWIEVTRSTVTHAVLGSRLVADRDAKDGNTGKSFSVQMKAEAGRPAPPMRKPRAPRKPKGDTA